MKCRSFLDTMLECSGEEPPRLACRLAMAVHIIFCPPCAGKMARFEAAREIMRRDFLPPPPSRLEGAIMDRIACEMVDIPLNMQAGHEIPLRSWVIIGCIVLVSLATVFLGIDFIHIAASFGSSFLVPVGITIGVIISCYGILFISSHLKEFSDRFGLH